MAKANPHIQDNDGLSSMQMAADLTKNFETLSILRANEANTDSEGKYDDSDFDNEEEDDTRELIIARALTDAISHDKSPLALLNAILALGDEEIITRLLDRMTKNNA